jgi:phospholipase C
MEKLETYKPLETQAFCTGQVEAPFMRESNATRRKRTMKRALVWCVALCLTGCGGSKVTAIQHVVFILKENRTTDSYFGTFPGVDGVTRGATSTGKVVPLSPLIDDFQGSRLCNGWDCAVNAIDGGRMDRFDLIADDSLDAYTQANESDIPNYWAYARAFVLADHYFTSVHGSSLPNHLFALAAQSGGVTDNPSRSVLGTACDGTVSGKMPVLDGNGNRTWHAPCFDFQTLPDVLQSHGITWQYYAYAGSDLANINHIRNGPEWQYANGTNEQFLADARNGRLPAVSWVIPHWEESEHVPNSVCQGENWTVEAVNAVMQGPDWNSTAIFVTYDDFGGFYDHVPPPQIDQFGLGPRVPLLIVSPFAKRGYISHTVYEHSSVLKFIETRYHLPPLTQRDAAASNMLDSFDFDQRPQPPLVLSTRHCP